MAEIKIYGTLVNDTNEAIVKSTQVAAVKQDGTAATQSAVNADLYAKYAAVGNAYRVKGTKATIAEVTALTSKAVGDVWNVTAEFTLNSKKYPAGTNVVWTGSEWDPLGGTVDIASLEAKIPTGYVRNDDHDALGYVLTNAAGDELFRFYIPQASYNGPGLIVWEDYDLLKSIQHGAQVNSIDYIKVNGQLVSTEENKTVSLSIPKYAEWGVHAEGTPYISFKESEGNSEIFSCDVPLANSVAAGLMSAADKQRLDGAASAKNLEATNLVIKSLGTRITALEEALTLK